MFVPFAMNIFVHLYGQFEQQNAGLIDKYLRYATGFFYILLAAVIALPFIMEVNTWMIIGSAIILSVFLITYTSQSSHRLWFFIVGIILARLLYSGIGIPLQHKGMFDYRPMMASVVRNADGQPVKFYLPADTLKLDIELGTTIHKWKKEPIIIPPFLIHQIPYYYYQFGGELMQYDTSLRSGNLYVSYKSFFEPDRSNVLSADYDKRAQDTLVLFWAY